MKFLIKLSLLIIFGFLSLNKIKAQKIQIVNGKNIVNPYYSRSDTSNLKIPNATWKKYLNKDFYMKFPD